jgi:CheY-like chemotaxis protein
VRIELSAHDEADTRAQASASGCVAYFRKPFPGKLLLEAIAKAITPTPESTGQISKQ